MVFILKLLYRTLNTPNKNEINQYKRTFKATLILGTINSTYSIKRETISLCIYICILKVPMFGLHYFLSPIVLCDSEIYSRVYNIFSRLLENLQVRNSNNLKLLYYIPSKICCFKGCHGSLIILLF